MDWVKLSTRYYNDPAMMRAGEAAEILYNRAFAYAGEQETDGFVPAEALTRLCPTKPRPRAAALVREGLWEKATGGWRIVGWDQTSRDQLAARREATGRRVAAHRHRTRSNAVTNGVSNGDCSGDVTHTEVEVEEELAAAAAKGPLVTPADLAVVEILRAKLAASDDRLAGVRTDLLPEVDVTEVARLVEVHGDAALVRHAVRGLHPPWPQHMRAFLAGWRTMPPPGERLALVRQICPEHHVQHSGTCPSCEADRKAGAR